MSRPLPDVEYTDFAPFWAGTHDHALLVPVCVRCGRRSWPPRLACPNCTGTAFDWQPITPTGTLYSWTTVGRAMLPGFESEVPYTVVVVAADDEPAIRFVGRLADGEPVPKIGAPLVARFTPVDEVTLVYWSADI